MNAEPLEQATGSSTGPPSSSASEPQLVRKLGLFDMTMLVMGSVIGVGIFRVPHTVAEVVGSPFLVLSAWLLGGIVSLAGSLVYAELTRRRPEVGGQYAYLREAYHPAVAFLYGWSLLWIVQSGGMASVAVVFADYFVELMRALGLADASTSKGPDAPLLKAIVTTSAIGVLALINCTGVRAAGSTQNVFMILKILALVTLVVVGLAFADVQWAVLQPVQDAGNRSALGGPAMLADWQLLPAFGAAMVAVLFAYGGFHTTTFVAGEVREPRRNLPRGLVLGICGVIALYLAVNFVCLRALGPDQLPKTEHPASDVMRQALGAPGAALISVGIAISAVGFLSQAMLTSPRVYYAMARDRLFLRSIAWVHPRTRVPIVAILLQAVFAIVIALTGSFEQILKYVMSVELVFFCLTALSLFVIRRRDSGKPDFASFSMPGHPATTLLFIAVNLAVVFSLFWKSPGNSAIGIGIALAGIPVYFLWRWREIRLADRQ